MRTTVKLYFFRCKLIFSSSPHSCSSDLRVAPLNGDLKQEIDREVTISTLSLRLLLSIKSI